jgi:hypothetical protein
VQSTVLLASRDPSLMASRCGVLLSAGYGTTCVLDLASALKQAGKLRPELIILGHSFSAQEQTEFIEQLPEVLVSASVICLRPGILRPPDLLRECNSLLAMPPHSIRIHVVNADEMESMDELGSPLLQVVPHKRTRLTNS